MENDQRKVAGRVLVRGGQRTLGRLSVVLPDWDVIRAENFGELLQASASECPDFVVSEAQSATREDLELLAQLNRSSKRVPVIFIKERNVCGDVLAAMRCGAFSYFSKTFADAALDELLRHAASGDAWSDGVEVVTATPQWVQVKVRCELLAADRVLQFMTEVCDLPDKEREEIGFALKEILMNAIEYGGGFDRRNWVEVAHVQVRRAIICRVKDPGDGFSMEELAHAAVSNPPDEPVRHMELREAKQMRPGGFGVLISRKMVDEMIYSERGNDVILLKYIDPLA